MNAPNPVPKPTGRLFEGRRKVFPRKVDGTFRRLKWAIMVATLAIYYLTPWLRWHRGAYAPDQAVLVDLAHRRFYMFSIEIWPNEFYYVVGLLVMAAVGLFLVTSAVGRAWCGYACPQTVWTDLFVHVERFIEGDRNAQLRLDRAPWGVEKLAKRTGKFASWLVIAALTGGAWIFYFADAPTLARQFISGNAPTVAYATVGVLTATTFIFGGLMREQVCIYMCPWPRIQSAMMDERSLSVTYRAWRGEPRTRGLKRSQEAEGPAGDCIDCEACIAVCPTGIDIREGAQIGCITCGLCIDACDQMMTRIGRPTQLIGYLTELDADHERRGEAAISPIRRLLHPRTIAYFLIWAGIGCAMLFALGNRARIGVSVLQTRNPIWVRLSDGAVRNGYLIKIRNMEERPRRFAISLDGMDALLWDEQSGRGSAARRIVVAANADQVAQRQIFLATSTKGEARTSIDFTVRALDAEGGSARATSFFERPETIP
ncbi:cytochrome c oxidase accessory protein FixG [Sphingomonas vulcanisoli]|uniref:Cytochrome c oxidase accessory protein FixG n=1 Tax=Sphingomonas vulcanisoli TaxID=1658060 RepID=A0ABX0TV47_9SPHN|nr:cytochrome c oxidase accessory protein CcoG [Sphingomonas vulcanisoli]NIJ09373.1 cytochrome c oxidase accessory protein FixG [Sphingomonas vulcanisoli]